WPGLTRREPPKEPTHPAPAPADAVEATVATIIEAVPPLAQLVEDDELEPGAPLYELASVLQTSDHKVTCPFHEGDDTPSLQLYPNHFHCFGCGAHGSALEWLIDAEGMTPEEALAAIQDGDAA